MRLERSRRCRLVRCACRRAAFLVCDLIERQGWWILPALLALTTLLAFLPTLDSDFVWDDDPNLVNNLNYRGLGWHQLRWMFTTVLLGHYIPLTWLTFGVDYTLWGMNPVGYHLTNLLLHMANTVIAYAVAVRLLAAALPAVRERVAATLGGAVAAVLFAVHPLRVESVAWATERRDVLCGLFYLLAVLAYLRACQGEAAEPTSRRRWYRRAMGLGALALLSKSMAVSLPGVLLVLDVYPLRRLGGAREGWLGGAARRVWAEKVPLVILSGATSLMALIALRRVEGVIPIAKVSIVDRIALSVYSLAFYLWKIALPVNLSPLYPRPERIEPLSWPYMVAGVVVGTVSAAAFLLRWRWPGLSAVWVSYVVMLLPVLGVVPNGEQIAADRYTYLPGLGWGLLVGAGLAAWCAAGDRRIVQERRAVSLAVVGMVLAVALGALTWQQVQVWNDPTTLWSHAVSIHPSALAHYNLGFTFQRRGEFVESIEHYRRAVAIKPDYFGARINLGITLARQGDLIGATEQLRYAAALRPDSAEAHSNLGVALARQGDFVGAIEHYRRAVALKPDFIEAHNNLGAALERQGRQIEALEHYRRAFSIRSGARDVQENRERARGGTSQAR